jgi:membrane-associated phospholipid phosphatase
LLHDSSVSSASVRSFGIDPAFAVRTLNVLTAEVRARSARVDRAVAPWIGVGEPRILCWISRLAEPRNVAAYAVALSATPRGRCAAVGAAAAGVLGHVLKVAFPRERPNKTRFTPLGCQSFPSTHTALTAALALGLAASVKRRPLRAAAYAAAAGLSCLVGSSRLRLCAHWPTDVVAGLAVGVMGHAFARLVR